MTLEISEGDSGKGRSFWDKEGKTKDFSFLFLLGGVYMPTYIHLYV